MSSFRSKLTVVLGCTLYLVLGACGSVRGDEEVRTEPEEGRADGPGLFTGKRGGIVIEKEVWTGASPSGDTEE